VTVEAATNNFFGYGLKPRGNTVLAGRLKVKRGGGGGATCIKRVGKAVFSQSPSSFFFHSYKTNIRNES